MLETGRLRAFVLIVGALAMGGCSGTTQAVSPTLPALSSGTASATTAVPSTSASPSEAVVVRAGPPPKTAFTKQGAEEFVRAYYATINAVLAARPGSADATELAKALLSYGSRDCECRYTQRFFVRHVADGDHFVGTGYRLQSVRINAMAGNSAVVLVSFSLGSVKTVSPAGRVMDVQQKVGAETDTFVVAYLSQSWKMTRQFVGKSH